MKLLTTMFVLVYSLTLLANPDWLNDASKACKKKELCAVGQGESRSVAERNARTALAKIFTTNIKSTFTSDLSSQNGDVQESTSEKIEEATDTALEGVEIKKTFESKTDWYALAVIDKKKASKGFKREIDKMDEQIKVLLEEQGASSAKKLEDLYIQRQILNKRYAFLTGKEVPAPVTFEEVFQNKKDKVGNAVIHVFLEEDAPKELEGALAQDLTEMGFKVTSGKVRNKQSTHVVTGSVVAQKQYLNVEGWEKYKFVVTVKASNSQQVETGTFTFDHEDQGRNFTQVLAKVLPLLKTKMKENISKLNFE